MSKTELARSVALHFLCRTKKTSRCNRTVLTLHRIKIWLQVKLVEILIFQFFFSFRKKLQGFIIFGGPWSFLDAHYKFQCRPMTNKQLVRLRRKK